MSNIITVFSLILYSIAIEVAQYIVLQQIHHNCHTKYSVHYL